MWGNILHASRQWWFCKLSPKWESVCLAYTQLGSLNSTPFLLLAEHFIKALPEYHVVGPVQVDASGHFLSYGLRHPVSSSRRKRAAGSSEDKVYYRISHEEKDLFFNLTVNREFLSNGYVVEKRYGNLSHVKMVASSGSPCHLRGTVLQQGTTIGTAALSACQGLVSISRPHSTPCLSL